MIHSSTKRRWLAGWLAVAVLCLAMPGAGAAEPAPGKAGEPNPAAVDKKPAAPLAVASRIFVLIVADSNDRDIGSAVRQDALAFEAMLKQAFEKEGLADRLFITRLLGDDATVDAIRQYYANLKSGPNDNLLFYISSHGSMTRGPGAPRHMLLVNSGRHQSLSRTDVHELMERVAHRGRIVLTDVCSGFGDEAGGGIKKPDGVPDVQAAANSQTIRALLLVFKGIVDITAAEDGTNAVPYNKLPDRRSGARSAFTAALLNLWTETRTYSNWAELFPRLRERTLQASAGKHQARAFSISEQVPGPVVAEPRPNDAKPPMGQPPVGPAGQPPVAGGPAIPKPNIGGPPAIDAPPYIRPAPGEEPGFGGPAPSPFIRPAPGEGPSFRRPLPPSGILPAPGEGPGINPAPPPQVPKPVF
jgi:hypothetical protein